MGLIKKINLKGYLYIDLFCNYFSKLNGALANYQYHATDITSGDSVLLYIGKTHSANVSQAFSLVKVRGGRVDGNYGEGTIYLGNNGIIFSARLDSPMSNLVFYINKLENEYYFYCEMESYCHITVEVAPTSNFELIMQRVSSSVVGSVNFWYNAWAESATKSDLTSQYEDITSQCVALNDSVTINGMYVYKMGSIITLCADITSKGSIYSIIQMPQKYTPRSADYSHFWYPYNIKSYSAYATINQEGEFYIQYESNIPAGKRYNVTITYHI